MLIPLQNLMQSKLWFKCGAFLGIPFLRKSSHIFGKLQNPDEKPLVLVQAAKTIPKPKKRLRDRVGAFAFVGVACLCLCWLHVCRRRKKALTSSRKLWEFVPFPSLVLDRRSFARVWTFAILSVDSLRYCSDREVLCFQSSACWMNPSRKTDKELLHHFQIASQIQRWLQMPACVG